MPIDRLRLRFIPVPFLCSTDLETFVVNKEWECNRDANARWQFARIRLDFRGKYRGGAYDFSLLTIFRKTFRELAGGGNGLRALEAQSFHAGREGGSRNAKDARSSASAGNFPVGLLQSTKQRLSFHPAEFFFGVRDGLGGCMRASAIRWDAVNRQDFPQGQAAIARDDYRALDYILQFADVAGPVIGTQTPQTIGSEFKRSFAAPRAISFHESPRQKLDVASALAQRRNGDGENVQAIE